MHAIDVDQIKQEKGTAYENDMQLKQEPYHRPTDNEGSIIVKHL